MLMAILFLNNNYRQCIVQRDCRIKSDNDRGRYRGANGLFYRQIYISMLYLMQKRRENIPYSVVAENLKVLDENALQEVNDFILFLIQKNNAAINKTVSSDVSGLRGALSFAADSSLVEKEKSAWNNAVKEKYEA